MKKSFLVAVLAILAIGASTAAGAYLYFSPRPDHYQSGINALKFGDLRRARLEFRNVIAGDKKNASAHYQLGISEARGGNPAAAEKAFRDALSLGFDPAIAKPALAETYLAQEHFKKLLDDISPVGASPELAARLYLARAVAYLHLQDIVKAEKSVNLAATLAPSLIDEALISAQLELARKNYVTAERDVDRALDARSRERIGAFVQGASSKCPR